jgi:hypothetical protein
VLGFGQSLDVIHIGVRADEHLALAQRKIHLPDQLDDLIDGLVKTDVDEDPLPLIEDKIDVASQDLPGLEVHLDHAGEYRPALEHGSLCRQSTGLPRNSRA